MPPILGHIIVLALLSVIVFFCGRNVLRSIRAELRGEATCSGCSGSCHSPGKKGTPECPACMSAESMKDLKELIRNGN